MGTKKILYKVVDRIKRKPERDRKDVIIKFIWFYKNDGRIVIREWSK